MPAASARILSISRRTDIPAFYTDWLMRRFRHGFAGWRNPFGGQCHRVSLRRDDVLALAFWTRNIRPLLPHLPAFRDAGYPCLFNYTITGLPAPFECHAPAMADAIDSLRALAALFPPEQINWRYDPIVLSDWTPRAFHLSRFAELAASLEGSVSRCLVSFVSRYAKVERNCAAFERGQACRVQDPDLPARRALIRQLAEMASRHGMTLHACCQDELLGEGVQKAHCIDGASIERLTGQPLPRAARRPSRPQCGCAHSIDIGAYDTCPHGCVYCYANANKRQATARHAAHDPESAFLGATREQSDLWLATLQ